MHCFFFPKSNLAPLRYLFILLLILIGVPTLVLELHEQLLDLLLKLPVVLGGDHALLSLGRELLLKVVHLRLKGR